MKKWRKKMNPSFKICLSFTIISICGEAEATRFECTSGDLTRTISVESQHQGWDIPCKVKYDKPFEGGVSYPWESENTKGYCHEKSDLLAEKLKKLGWECVSKEAVE
jgi:hypothetical protein